MIVMSVNTLGAASSNCPNRTYECCMLSFGWFPGVWNLYTDVSEHCLFHSVPKRRNINFRRRGITQKKAYNIQ